MPDDWIWIWYYDSAGAIQTQGLNVFAHFEDYILILIIFQRFSLHHWGFLDGVNSPAWLRQVMNLEPPSAYETDAQRVRTGSTDEKAAPPTSTIVIHGVDRDEKTKAMVVNFESQVYKPSTANFSGRRTTIFEAGVLENDPSECRFDYCAKFSYPEVGRSNEAETVWIAHKIVENDAQARSTLPEITAYKDFEETSTDRIRHHLRSIGSDKSLVDKSYGECILRCIFEERSRPLEHVKGKQLVRAL
jgi:hypothetical protein